MNEYTQQAEQFLKDTKTTYKAEFLRLGKHFADDTTNRNIFKCTFTNARGSFDVIFGTSIVDTYKETKISRWDSLSDTDEIEFFTGFSIPKIKVTTYTKRLLTKKEIERPNGKLIEALTMELQLRFGNSRNEYIDTIKNAREQIQENKNLNARYDMYFFREYVRKALSKKVDDLKKDIITLYKDPKDPIIKPKAYDVLACLTKYDPGTFEDFCADFGYDTDSRKAYQTYKNVIEEYKNVCCIWSDDEIELLQEIN